MNSVSNQFYILHDQHKINCIVGQGLLADGVKTTIDNVEHVSFEYVQSQSIDWFQRRQFIVALSDVAFKQKIVNFLNEYNVHYFSIVGHNNIIGVNTKIGHGTFINSYNDFLGGPTVGDHCVITTHCQLGHQVKIKDFCHVSAHCFISNIAIGTGNVIGLKSLIFGNPTDNCQTADYCNFIINSVVTCDIKESGTYFGHKKMSSQNSLTHRIL